VVSSDRSVSIPESPIPRLVLSVTWKAVDEVFVAWSFRYRVGDDDRIYGLDESRGLRGLRRPADEARLVEGLELDEEQRLRLCGSPRERRLLPEQTFRGALAIAFVEGTLEPLERSGQVEIEEIGVRPAFEEVTDAPVIRFEPRGTDAGNTERTDWLDLEVVVTVGTRFVGLAQLLEAMTLGAERIVLRDGAHLRIDRPEFARLAELVHEARELEEQPPDGVRVAAHDLGLWDELAEIGLVDAQAARWVEAARALRELTSLPAVEPTGLRADLRHYQLDGFRWLAFLWEAGLGGVLADDMGLGKTLQALALVAHARARTGSSAAPGADGPFLVVAPTSVVGTWAQEAATFTPGLTVRTVTQSRARRGTSLAELHEEADVVVTSYTLYRLEVDDYLALPWGGLVLDEAQMVKNHTGKTYQCVRRLETPFRLALTGTPMENRLMELWSLLSIVAPGLYPYPQRFVERVANPVEKEGDREVLDRFRRRIRPFLLRRTKDLVAADLPPKQEQVLEVQLTPKHRRIYDLHLQRERQKVLGLLGDFDRQRIAIFRSLTRLRQLSLDAGLLDPEYDGVGSAKLDLLVDHLQEVLAEGHRALVFSQFTSFLGRVRRRLDAEGIESKYLDGRTRKRGDVIAGFKRGEGAVFLISLKAGGVGLTLTEADYVFVLDPWWNPAVEAQAVDRTHRIGQRRPVIVYRLVSTATIEEKVMELKARKAALFSRVLDGDGGMGTPIGADDVRALLEE
jgi:superfamily II DNA or RNA helicase